MNTPDMTLSPGAELKRVVTLAHKALDDLIAVDMSRLGLTVGEADVLTVILIAGDSAPAPTDIANWLSLTTAGATGRLNTLESKRLIERRPHESDGRRLTLHLTEEGHRVARTVIDAKDHALAIHVIDHLGPKATQLITSGLHALIAVAIAATESGRAGTGFTATSYESNQ